MQAEPFRTEPTRSIAAFLNSIGISVVPGAITVPTFLPGLRIEAGGIVVDEEKLEHPGDILHEAGHIAVTPPEYRAALNDNIAPDNTFPFDDGGEVEAIAWSWAALVHLGLPGEVLFHPGGYNGSATGLHTSFSLGVYPGLPGLTGAGMALGPAQAKDWNHPPYPAMLKWLRE